MLNLSRSENLDVCQTNVRICPQIYPTLIKHTQVILIGKKKFGYLILQKKKPILFHWHKILQILAIFTKFIKLYNCNSDFLKQCKNLL